MTNPRCNIMDIIPCCTDMAYMVMTNEFREGVIQADDGTLYIRWKDEDCMPHRYMPLRYCPSCGKKIERRAKAKHTCPVCGNGLELYVIIDLFSKDGAVSRFYYGCPRCSLMINGQCPSDMTDEEKASLEETSHAAWLDSLKKMDKEGSE